MACKICNVRRPRRYCPGVGGEICTVCCGTEREITVSCPLDCVYLREARSHEKPPLVDPKQIPNLDVEVTDSFLREHDTLLGYMMHLVTEAGLSTPDAVDNDVREALAALIRTYRTRQSGLYYDSKPDNLIALGVLERIEKGIEEFRESMAKRVGLQLVRDADILGVLVFLQRVEYQMNNGRKRGRAFIDFLLAQAPAIGSEENPTGSQLILP